MKKLLLAGLALVLSGCALVPDYRPLNQQERDRLYDLALRGTPAR